jgi:hypothetical protein
MRESIMTSLGLRAPQRRLECITCIPYTALQQTFCGSPEVCLRSTQRLLCAGIAGSWFGRGANDDSG